MNRSVVTHQRTAWWRSHRATSRCTAGKVWRRGFGRGGARVACATPPRVMPLLPHRQPDQNAIGQHDRHGMPMKPPPQAALILVPAQLALGLCVELCNRMPPMGIPSQRFKGRVRRQITPEILALLGLPLGGTLPDEPAFVTGPIAGHAPAPPPPRRLPP